MFNNPKNGAWGPGWKWFILLMLVCVLAVITLSIALDRVEATSLNESETTCEIFLPLVSQPCDGYWYSCPSETWPECECPWCLPDHQYCVKWDPEIWGDVTDEEWFVLTQ